MVIVYRDSSVLSSVLKGSQRESLFRRLTGIVPLAGDAAFHQAVFVAVEIEITAAAQGKTGFGVCVKD